MEKKRTTPRKKTASPTKNARTPTPTKSQPPKKKKKQLVDESEDDVIENNNEEELLHQQFNNSSPKTKTKTSKKKNHVQQAKRESDEEDEEEDEEEGRSSSATSPTTTRGLTLVGGLRDATVGKLTNPLSSLSSSRKFDDAFSGGSLFSGWSPHSYPSSSSSSSSPNKNKKKQKNLKLCTGCNASFPLEEYNDHEKTCVQLSEVDSLIKRARTSGGRGGRSSSTSNHNHNNNNNNHNNKSDSDDLLQVMDPQTRALKRQYAEIDLTSLPVEEQKEATDQRRRPYSSSSSSSYSSPYSSVSSASERKYECPLCGAKFFYESTVVDHAAECQGKDTTTTSPVSSSSSYQPGDDQVERVLRESLKETSPNDILDADHVVTDDSVLEPVFATNNNNNNNNNTRKKKPPTGISSLKQLAISALQRFWLSTDFSKEVVQIQSPTNNNNRPTSQSGLATHANRQLCLYIFFVEYNREYHSNSSSFGWTIIIICVLILYY